MLVSALPDSARGRAHRLPNLSFIIRITLLMRMRPRKLLHDIAMEKVFISPAQEQTLLLSATSHSLIWAALPVSIRGLAGVQHWGHRQLRSLDFGGKFGLECSVVGFIWSRKLVICSEKEVSYLTIYDSTDLNSHSLTLTSTVDCVHCA